MVALAGIARAEIGAPPIDSLTVQPFTLQTYDGAEHPAEIGHFVVPENRSHSGRSIRLGFVRLRSTAVHPKPPIVFLSGGPGVPATAMARVPVYYDLFERLRSVADVILLDQRGMGMSSVEVGKASAPISPKVFMSPEALLEAMEHSVAASVDARRKSGVDVAAYTTSANADDVDDLRRVLGESRVSLLGFSYGTSLALVTARRHPDRIHRMVLEGVEAPDRLLVRPSTWDRQIARLSALAARDTALDRGLPSLDSLFHAALTRVRGGVTVRVRDPISGEPVELSVGETGLLYLLGRHLNGRKIAVLPALLRAFAEGDTAAISGPIESAYSELRTGFSATNMALAISLGWTAGRRREVEADSVDAHMNLVNLQWNPRIRTLLGLEEESQFISPVWNSCPTLLLAGTLDCNTPMEDIPDVLRNLPNARLVSIENGGHETLPAPAVKDLVVQFFAERTLPPNQHVVLDAPEFLPVAQGNARLRTGRAH